ncbi:NAD(P)-binding protein [Sarocladium strictum]
MSVLVGLRAAWEIFYSGHFITLPIPKPIPGIEHQTIVVTGSNVGLGYEASQHLLRIGVGRLIMAVRNIDKGQDAREKLLEATGRKPEAVEVWELDMCSYDSVKSFAKRTTETLTRLDAVLANAAICTTNFALDEGYERSLTVNVVSPTLLLLLLLPKLREAPSVGRFSFVSSKVHCLVDMAQLRPVQGTGPILERLSDKNTANMENRYFLTKLLALYATRNIAKAMSASGKKEAVVNAPNPSYCISELERESSGFSLKFKHIVMGARSSDMGSRALVHGVLAGKETHGAFLNDCHPEKPGATVIGKEGQAIGEAFVKELLETLEAISPGITENI